MAAMSAYGKARRPRSGNEADRVSDTDAVGTGMAMSDGQMSIAFMESDKVPRVEALLASGGASDCRRRWMAAMSAYGKASRPRPGSDIDRMCDGDTAGTVEMFGRQMSIAFMEPNSVPRVGVLFASGGTESAADSVVFRPRGDEAGSPADRTSGIVLAQGDWIELSRVSPSCGRIQGAVVSGCVAPRSEVRGTARVPSGDKLGLWRSGIEFVRRRENSGAGRTREVVEDRARQWVLLSPRRGGA